MVLHELVTNAATYGALSTPHGRVEVSWNHERGEHAANLLIEWREVGGPTILAPPQCLVRCQYHSQSNPKRAWRFGRSNVRNLTVSAVE